MQKTLFLLLFLQVNLVFGQIKLLQNLRLRDYNYASEPELQFVHSNKKKTVKKVEIIDTERRTKFTVMYQKDGQLNQYNIEEIQPDGTTVNTQVKAFYHKNGRIDKEEHTFTLEQKGEIETIKTFRHYKMLKNEEDATQRWICINYSSSEIVESMIFEKINTKTESRTLRYFNFDTQKWKVGIKDSIAIDKILELKEANRRFEIDDLTFFGYETYQYEKGKPISKKTLVHRNHELGEEITSTLKYETEDKGYLLQNGKTTNIFSLNENGLISISSDGITKIEDNGMKFIYDEYGNWTSSIYYDKDEKMAHKTKHKIEYYD